MFSTVLDMLRPSEKSKSNEKVDFEELPQLVIETVSVIFGPFLDIILYLQIESLRFRMENLRTTKGTVKHTIQIFVGIKKYRKWYQIRVQKNHLLRSGNDRICV